MPAVACPKCDSGRITIGYTRGRIYKRNRVQAAKAEMPEEQILTCHSCGYMGPAPEESFEPKAEKSN